MTIRLKKGVHCSHCDLNINQTNNEPYMNCALFRNTDINVIKCIFKISHKIVEGRCLYGIPENLEIFFCSSVKCV